MQRRAVFGLFLLPLARGQGTCAPTPALTQGPYYLRDVPQREDLREGLPGVPLRLLLRVRDRACRPLQGARVDLWHTDALGRYSGVNAPGTFCRGWQATDERGEVAFLTLFPGWYPSRTPPPAPAGGSGRAGLRHPALLPRGGPAPGLRPPALPGKGDAPGEQPAGRPLPGGPSPPPGTGRGGVPGGLRPHPARLRLRLDHGVPVSRSTGSPSRASK